MVTSDSPQDSAPAVPAAPALPLAQVAGKIAHDFNNILMVLMGTTEVFDLELPPDSPLRDELRILQSAVDRVKTLATTLATAARSAAPPSA